ncbi:PAS domain S-box protein [Ostertagia ostertagi]
MLTGDSVQLEALAQLTTVQQQTLNRIQKLTADNRPQQLRIGLLHNFISQDFDNAERVINLRKTKGLAAAAGFMAQQRSPDYLALSKYTIAQIEEEENKLLSHRQEANRRSAARVNILLVLLIAIILTLVAIIIRTLRFDLSTLRKAEKERNDSEEQLRLLLTNVKDHAIFTTDVNGNIINWNEGAERVKGYSPEEVTGKHISLFYTADKVQTGEPDHNLAKARESGQYETEGWRVKKDGTVFLANNVFTALYNKQQQLKGFAEITRDITEQRKKQDQISYLSNLVEQTNDAIFSTDTRFAVLSWNRAAEKLYGYTRQQVMGQQLAVLIKSRLTDAERKKAVNELKQKGFYQSESEFSNKNGETIFVLASVTSIVSDTGEVTGYVGVHKDITERKKLEKALTLANEQLEEKVKAKAAELTGIFERITDAFVAFDKNWCYTYVNKKAGELFNRAPSSLIGKNIWEEFPQTIQSPVHALFLTSFKEQKFASNSDYFPPLKLWLENYVYPSPEGVSVFIKDITIAKKAEEEVSISNERFEIVANATNDVVWDWDLVNQQIWWNKNYYTNFGYPEEGSNDASSWYNGIHPEDKQRVTDSIQQAIESGALSWSDEYRFLKADGTHVFVLDRGYIMHDKEKKPYRMAGAMVDVTGIRKAEERIINNEQRFRALLQNSADGLILTDAAGIILDISPSGTRIYGHSYDDMIGKTRPDLVHPDDLPLVGNAFVESAKQPGAITVCEYRHKLANGNYRWLECSFNNLLHEPFVNAMVLNFRDVNERKVANEKVKTNEQMLIRAQEIGQFGSWEYDAITQEIKWSDSMYRIHGVSKDQPVSLELFFQHVYPGDISKIQSVFRNLQPSEPRFRDEYRFLRKKSILGYALTTIDSVFEEGRLRKAMGVVQDITEQKKAEEVLRQSEARYRKAQSQGKLGHWELDIVNKVFFLSDEIYGIYDLAPRGVAEGYDAFLNIIHPDDKQNFITELNEVLNGHKSMDIIHRIVRKDGSIQFIHEIAELERSESGQPLRLTGMAQDITEQKIADEKLRRSEHKYRLLFENNPMPMWMSSIPELNIIDVNQSALRQYGYTREEFLRLNSMDLRLLEDEDVFLKEINTASSGQPSTMQWRHKKKDGSVIYVEIFNYQIMYEGKPVWLGLSIDITEKTRAEALLKKSYEDVRQLASHLQDVREEERAHMAREIHDELGQQLTGLKMDISWLSRKKDLDGPQRDQKLKEILTFLDGTVNTVRKLSAELRPSILDDLGLVEALEWWSTEFEKRSGVPCSFQPPVSDVQVPSAIAIGLFRIFQESLTNVARHANATNVVSQLECANGRLILKIADNGRGFDSSNTSQKKTLGLLGMKERTLMMGGSYEIISRPGNGATVIITVPFNHPENL